MPEYKEILEREVVRYRDAKAEPLALVYSELALGGILKMMSEPAASITHLYTALGLISQLEKPEMLARIQQEIGLNYYLQGRWEQALEFFQKADAFYIATGMTGRHRIQVYLIGLCLTNTGQLEKAMELLGPLYDSWMAEKNHQRSLESGSGYADALRRAGHLDSAQHLYQRLIEMALGQEGSMRGIMGRLEAGLAHVYYQMGRIREAREAALSSLEYVRKFEYFFPKLEALEILYKSNRDMKEWEEAFRYLEMYTHDRDSLQNEETNVQLGVARAVFDHEQHEAVIRTEEANKRQVLIVGLIVAGLMVVLVGIFTRTLSKQKARANSLLANILPRETIVELKRTGEVTPRIHNNVSIMFCDVRDFTRIAESLAPHELVTMLDSYIRAFDDITARYGLEKIKTIGDAYMAAGGLHGSEERSAEACVRAALEMISVAESMREPSMQLYGHAFDYRIGIHTGNVISGMVGRDKYAYDIWGDAVNVASRMEHHSEIGRVNISGDTNRYVSSIFSTEYRGKISVKNKGEVDMYFVNAPSSID